ncbi:MAG TPA: hypothetical protein VN714_31610 [Trebonia sp.]|nr:hypothetical protein [Trebonia sp.]
MYFAYTIIQAERPRTNAEQRADDLRRGEMAHAVAKLLHRGRAVATPTAPVPAQPRTVRHHTRRYA